MPLSNLGDVRLTKAERDEIAAARKAEFEAKLSNDQRLYYENDVPDRFKRLYLDALFTSSPKKKIKANCLDCVCWSPLSVTACELEHCPFWSVRPYQKT